MVGMTIWLAAALGLLPALAVPLSDALRRDVGGRLVAIQLGGTLTAFLLAILSFAFDQPSFMDLALCAMLVAVPGTYVYTLFMERWL